MNNDIHSSLPSRLAPRHPFPPYSYVNGQWPHPMRDPAGHQFGQPVVASPAIDLENWPTHAEFLFGCDLFNYGYYWEAHEAWEGIWHACGRRGALADLLKGLIKLAAAGVKFRENRPAGVARHAARAAQLFAAARDAAGTDALLGLSLATLIDAATGLSRGEWAFLPAPRTAASATAHFLLLPGANSTTL